MGCDGGTIPKRDELVRTKKKAEQVEKDLQNNIKWRACHISQQPLAEPIVACELGRLYNKESVIEFLINKTDQPKAVHIKSLKDVRDLVLTKNPAFKTIADKGDVAKDFNVSPFICPVVGLEMNGSYRFAFIWTCGCVMSERALKEVKSPLCHKCGKTYDPEDIVILNPTEEELKDLQTRMEKRRLLAKQEKKSKKKIAESTPIDTDQPSTSKAAGQAVKLMTKRKSDGGSKLVSNGMKKEDTEGPESKKSKSVQDDPSKSQVFKSLFTSSEAGKHQPRAHWITYNPQYF